MEEFDGVISGKNGWALLTRAQRDDMGFSPNRGSYHTEAERAAVVCRQLDGGDWSVSSDAVNYLIKSQDEGRIKRGYVVLIDHNSETIIGVKSVKDFRREAGGALSSGIHGLYWMVDKDFQPVNKRRPF